MQYTLNTVLVYMLLVLVVVVLQRFRGVLKVMTANGTPHMVKRHSHFGTLQLTQDARHSSSIFHRGG
ncbi:ORF081 [Staphylococcus phage 96]|uniref:ORF081 n=1 Tax=Staphylococcus phage 96 TaxID=2936815 RepID=Q4ZBY7_9CAUD|nr:ORF081 [Staphylococcus phage 96]